MPHLRSLASPEVLAGAASGLLFSLAVPPSPLWPLGYVCLVPMLWVMFHPESLRDGRRFSWRRLALAFGLVHHVTLLYWIAFLTDASPLTFRWVLPLAVVLLALYMTLWYLPSFWLAARLSRGLGVQAIWWLPALWVLAEWLRGLGEMGFPWMRLATTQLMMPRVLTLQLAGLVGELGVTLMVAWVNVFLAMAIFALRGHPIPLGRAVLHRWWPVVALVVVLGGTCLYGWVTVRQLDAKGELEEGLRVAVVQGDVDLRDKWDPARLDSTLVPYTVLTQRAAQRGARLAVWPETAIPLDFLRSPTQHERIRTLARTSALSVFTGFPERAVGPDGGLLAYNSSVLLDEAGVPRGRYRKMHLLPFGERMPFQGLIPLLGRLDLGQAEWAVGPEQTVFEVEGHRFINMICFESIFSGLARSGVRNGANFLVNISNDGWFGRTLGPHQHGWMAAMRAAENRVPLVRCANNGISFVAEASGRIIAMAGLGQRTALVETIHPSTSPAPYTRWGDGLLLILLVLGGGVLILVTRSR